MSLSKSLVNISNKKQIKPFSPNKKYYKALLLNKKTKRSNFDNYYNYQKYLKKKNQKKRDNGIYSPSRMESYRNGIKSLIRPSKQIQSTINDFFTTKTDKDEMNISSDDLFGNKNDISYLSYFQENSSNSKSNKKNKTKKRKLKKRKLEETHKFNGDKIREKNNNQKIINDSSEEDENIDNSIIDYNNHYLYKNKNGINNPFSKFSNIVKNRAVEIRIDDDLYDYNVNKNTKEYNNYSLMYKNGIFSKSEIKLAISIEKEFRLIIYNTHSETDKLFKATIFFINKGFSEIIRYIYYQCIINHGFPLIEKFNNFYDLFISYCSKEKKNSPDKMYIEFYTEYIFNTLVNEKSSMAKNKLISEFFFNGENIDIIKNNLNFINNMRENIIHNRSYIQNYIDTNFDLLFKDMNTQLNKEFPKSKTVLCKILSNIVLECDKNGYLKYKDIINNDEILFEGLKIKGQLKSNLNLRKMISLKIFGQKFADKKFNNVIQEYLLQLFSNYKIENNNA
jgi:hypothetical protein